MNCYLDMNIIKIFTSNKNFPSKFSNALYSFYQDTLDQETTFLKIHQTGSLHFHHTTAIENFLGC